RPWGLGPPGTASVSIRNSTASGGRPAAPPRRRARLRLSQLWFETSPCVPRCFLIRIISIVWRVSANPRQVRLPSHNYWHEHKFAPRSALVRLRSGRATNHKDLLPASTAVRPRRAAFRDLVNAFIADMGGL